MGSASINLNKNNKVSDSDLLHFGDIKHLSRLILNDASITGDGLKHVSRIENLEELSIGRTQVTDEGVGYLVGLNDLQSLNLAFNAKISDASCRYIARLAGLRKLNLGGTMITDDGLGELSALGSLRDLDLNFCQITATGLTNLHPLKSLQVLSLKETTIADEAVSVLAEFENLRLLDLFETQMTKEGATRLKELLPNCTILHRSLPANAVEQQAAQWALDNGGEVSRFGKVGGIEAVSEKYFAVFGLEFPKGKGPATGAANLERLPAIRWLNWYGLTSADAECEHIGKLVSLVNLLLESPDLTEVGLERLKSLSELVSLTLTSAKKIDDDAVAQLSAFQHLSKLQISNTPISDDGLSHLAGLKQSLRDLTLRFCPNITGAGVQHLTELSKLRLLVLGSTPISDDAVQHLKQMKSLRVLDLYYTKISAKGAAELQKALPDCVVFHESLENVPFTAQPSDTDVHEPSPMISESADTIKHTPSHVIADPQRRAAEAVLRLGGQCSLSVGATRITRSFGAADVGKVPNVRVALNSVILEGQQGSVRPRFAGNDRCEIPLSIRQS